MYSSCSIHQPNFFPRLHTVAKIASSDVWVSLSRVQFSGRDYQHRAMLARQGGEHPARWLSLHIARPESRAMWISEAHLLDPKSDLLRASETLRHLYRRSAYWDEVSPSVLNLLESLSGVTSLATIDRASTQLLLSWADWSGHTILDDTLNASDDRTGRLVDICLAVGVKRYICGPGGASYLDLEKFRAAGIAVSVFSVAPEIRELKLSALHFAFTQGLQSFRDTIQSLIVARAS